MGLSYYDGKVSSDCAFDNTWYAFEAVLRSIEERAFIDDFYLRVSLEDHPKVGEEVLVETIGRGHLEKLVPDDILEDVGEWGKEGGDPHGRWAALDQLVSAAQIEVGAMRMLSARYRRIVREAHRALMWWASNVPVSLQNGPGSPRGDLTLGDGFPGTVLNVVRHPEAFTQWVRGFPSEDFRTDPRRMVYSEIRAVHDTLRRSERWLDVASKVCIQAAPLVQKTKTSWIKTEEGSGILNHETGEQDPRGFPVISSDGQGVDYVELDVPGFEGTKKVIEIDQVVDDSVALFRAKQDPLQKLLHTEGLKLLHTEGLTVKELVLRYMVTQHQPDIYRAWLRLSGELLNEDISNLFRVSEVEELLKLNED